MRATSSETIEKCIIDIKLVDKPSRRESKMALMKTFNNQTCLVSVNTVVRVTFDAKCPLATNEHAKEDPERPERHMLVLETKGKGGGGGSNGGEGELLGDAGEGLGMRGQGSFEGEQDDRDEALAIGAA
ncbi:unnamed protein product [Prunus armeniaca]|uniref:Uncharacterized protein n=1 Tax=Prunus armeniaca TaxID=36596 RepID=A0A6J5U9H4_PRUAR|nr:unnamed protein product [Prunus armeniaca]